MAAVEIQLPPIAQFLGVPTVDLVVGLEEPSKVTIQRIYQAILSRASEFETLRAQKLKADVDLENAVHGQQSRSNVSKAAVEKHLAEISRLRTQVESEGKLRAGVWPSSLALTSVLREI